MGDPIGHSLAVLEASGGHAFTKFLQGLRPDLHMLADNEALDPQSLGQDQAGVGHRDRFTVVPRNHSANRHPAKCVHAREHRVHHAPADVLEQAIDPARRRSLERPIEPGRILMSLVINTRVKTKFIDDIGTLVRATCDTDCASPMVLGELADRTANCTAGSRDHDGLARLGFADFQKTVPGRNTRHSDRPKVCRQRYMLGIDFPNSPGLIRIDHAELLPSTHANDRIANGVLRMAGCDDFTNRSTNHDGIDRLRSGVVLAVIHTTAHVGVKAEVMMAHQNLALAEFWDGLLAQREIVRGDGAGWTAGKNDLGIQMGIGLGRREAHRNVSEFFRRNKKRSQRANCSRLTNSSA